MADTIFGKIVAKEVAAAIRYEDDEFIAIDDIHPMAPVHVLLIPKKAYVTLEEFPLQDVQLHGRLLTTARQVASRLGIQENYKIMMNIGKAVQQVHHVHLHIMGGWKSPQAEHTPDATT